MWCAALGLRGFSGGPEDAGVWGVGVQGTGLKVWGLQDRGHSIKHHNISQCQLYA